MHIVVLSDFTSYYERVLVKYINIYA